MDEQSWLVKVREIVTAFVTSAKDELRQRWDKWELDLSQNEFHEVAGALLARQVTLARELAECPSIWNEHIAPIILRAMADVFISLAWVLENPIERSQKLIFYGLGQAKLQVEHRKTEMATRQAVQGEEMVIKATEEWINTQRATFLTEVNLGSWSGVSTRQMAEEAGCLNFYNYVYTPFSACTHSMWHHIARYNLKQCGNPLHRFHKVPQDPELPIAADYLYLAAKYLEKTFATFDEKVGIKIQGPSAFDNLCKDLERISQEIDMSAPSNQSETAESAGSSV